MEYLFQLHARREQWQAAGGQVGAAPPPVVNTVEILPADHLGEERDYVLQAELYGLQYAHELEAFSYGPRPIPLALYSLFSFPPDFISTDLEARRFLAGAETVRLSPFGITYMVSSLASPIINFVK